MNPLYLFSIQVGLDVLICGLILYVLWRVGKNPVPAAGGDEARQDLQRLITESQHSAEQFLDALAEGRKALKEVASALDERGARLRALCERAEELAAHAEPRTDADHAPLAPVSQERVRRMALDGASVTDIVRQTGLTEGEVRLIIDLARSRDENH